MRLLLLFAFLLSGCSLFGPSDPPYVYPEPSAGTITFEVESGGGERVETYSQEVQAVRYPEAGIVTVFAANTALWFQMPEDTWDSAISDPAAYASWSSYNGYGDVDLALDGGVLRGQFDFDVQKENYTFGRVTLRQRIRGAFAMNVNDVQAAP